MASAPAGPARIGGARAVTTGGAAAAAREQASRPEMQFYASQAASQAASQPGSQLVVQPDSQQPVPAIDVDNAEDDESAYVGNMRCDWLTANQLAEWRRLFHQWIQGPQGAGVAGGSVRCPPQRHLVCNSDDLQRR